MVVQFEAMRTDLEVAYRSATLPRVLMRSLVFSSVIVIDEPFTSESDKTLSLNLPEGHRFPCKK